MACSIARSVAREIADEASASAPLEVCGLLAGRGNHISRRLPVANVASDPRRRFELDLAEQLQALKTIDVENLDWLGAYHSHPAAPPIPSDADIAAAVDERLLQLIVSLEQAQPRFKLWRIDRESVTPVELTFDTETARDLESPLSAAQKAAIVVVGLAALLLLLLISFSLLPPAPELAPAPSA